MPAAHDHVLNMKQDFRSIVVLLPTGKDRGWPLRAEEAVSEAFLEKLSQ